MKKLCLVLILCIFIVGCGSDDFESELDQYIDEQELVDVKRIMTYEDDSDIKGIIFKAVNLSDEELLYYFEYVAGKGNAKYGNGMYSAGPLLFDGNIISNIYDGEDFGYDKSYVIGMLDKKITSLTYKGKNIDYKSETVVLNGNKTAITVWLMSYDNGDDIDVADFSYQ